MSSLPMPPMVPGPSGGPVGGMIQNPTGAQGGLPYAPNPLAGAAQGITSFVNNYLAEQEAVQQNAHSKFMQGVQASMLGIPVDQKQILKSARIAGIPIRTEPYTPEEKQYKLQKSQQDQAWGQMMQGGMTPGVMQQASQLAAGPIPTAPAPLQQPGFFGRLGQAFGIGRPPVSTDSPGGDWLRNLSAAAQVGGGLPGQVARQGETSNLQQALQRKGFDVSNMLMNITSKAYQGDPNAMEMLSRSGIFKELPGDDIARAMSMAHPDADPSLIKQRTGEMLLWLEGGGPQMRTYMMGLAKDMVPRFTNQPNPLGSALQYAMNPFDPNSPQPQRTVEETEKLGSTFGKLHDAYPSAPANLLWQATEASEVPGNDALKNKIFDTLSEHFKSSGEVQQQQFGVTSSIEAQRAAAQTRDAESQAQRVVIERNQFGLNQVKAIAEASGEQGKLGLERLQAAKSDSEYHDALDIIAGAASKLHQVEVNYGGKKFTLSDPIKVIDDWRTGPSWRLGLGGGGRLQEANMSPGTFGPPGQAPPTTYGQHPVQQKVLDSLRGLSQDEASTILKQSGVPPQGLPNLPFANILKALQPPPSPTGLE